jgi:beta-lactamase class A
MKLTRPVAAVTLLASALVASCARPRPTLAPSARSAVERLIERSGAEVGVAMRTLDGRQELLLGASVSFHAASTMKVPVMIEMFRQARARRLRLDDEVKVVNRFPSIVDGSPYLLTADSDSEPFLYKAVGQTRTYRQLCELMITISSNLAANILIDRLGVENIRKTTAALGADGMNVRRGVEDTKAFQAGQNNTTTANALLVLLEAIAHGKAVSPSASREMVEVLKQQKFNEGIPAGLPPGTRVAHKTGSITRIQHDAGIVYRPRPYVLVVLVRGLDDETKAHKLIADITRTVDEATNGARGRR